MAFLFLSLAANALANPQVQQGGSAGFSSLGSAGAIATTWQIMLGTNTIATSTTPNNWSVSFTIAPNGRMSFQVGAPAAAAIATGYRVAYRNGSTSSYYALFDVIAAPPPGSPGAPTNLTVSGGSSPTAVLTWTAPAGSGLTYNVYEGASPGGESATPIASGLTATTYTVTGLGGSYYFFTVRAVNTSGASAPSNEVSLAVNIPPPPPPVLSATDSGTTVTLNWTFDTSATDEPYFEVWRSSDGGATFTQIGGNVYSLTYADSGLALNAAYRYYVVAYFYTRSESHTPMQLASNTVSVATALAAPSDLAAYATGSGKITLYWSGVPSATGYNVYRGITAGGENYNAPVNAGGPVTTQDTGPGVTNMSMYTDTGLTNGQEYFYTVEAVNGSSQSGSSNEDSDVPDPAAVPWDSANPSAILSAFRSAFASDVSNVGTGSYALRVVGPDNVIYDDSYSTAQSADGTVTPGTNQFVRPDGSSLSLPDDLGQFETPSGTSTPGMTPNSVGTALPASKGPYRRVRTGPTALYRGESGMVTLPSPQITPTGHTHGDTAMIFLGASGVHTEVDTGLQYSPTYGDWEMFMNINGRYVGTGNNPIPPTHLLNIPANFIHVPSGDVPTVSYWAWGRLPSQNRAKLSLLLVDDTLYGSDVGALGAPSKYLGKTENVRAKRVHAIAQNAPGVALTGSQMDGASWSQGYVILTDSAGTLQGWSSADGTSTSEDGSYEGGHSSVDAIETSPYIAEDSITIDINP